VAFSLDYNFGGKKVNNPDPWHCYAYVSTVEFKCYDCPTKDTSKTIRIMLGEVTKFNSNETDVKKCLNQTDVLVTGKKQHVVVGATGHNVLFVWVWDTYECDKCGVATSKDGYYDKGDMYWPILNVGIEYFVKIDWTGDGLNVDVYWSWLYDDGSWGNVVDMSGAYNKEYPQDWLDYDDRVSALKSIAKKAVSNAYGLSLKDSNLHIVTY
jgi:hypothetical protein